MLPLPVYFPDYVTYTADRQLKKTRDETRQRVKMRSVCTKPEESCYSSPLSDERKHSVALSKCVCWASREGMWVCDDTGGVLTANNLIFFCLLCIT